jgi:hypothetical protein
VSSPSTPSSSLGLPDLFRLRPVQRRLSKASIEKEFPAQSKSTERLFGRGRQSANQRITGGLVSHDQAKRSHAARVGIRDTPTGSNLCCLVCLWGTYRRLAARYGSTTRAPAAHAGHPEPAGRSRPAGPARPTCHSGKAGREPATHRGWPAQLPQRDSRAGRNQGGSLQSMVRAVLGADRAAEACW